jgi:Bacterial mobilisation protein (MobC)
MSTNSNQKPSSPRSESRQRTAFLTARCTPQEKEYAEKRAFERDLSLGDYLRSIAIGQRPIQQVRRITPTAEAILLLKAELNKIGSNINQIARVGNQSGSVSPAQVSAMLEHLKKCYVEIQKLTQP